MQSITFSFDCHEGYTHTHRSDGGGFGCMPAFVVQSERIHRFFAFSNATDDVCMFGFMFMFMFIVDFNSKCLCADGCAFYGYRIDSLFSSLTYSFFYLQPSVRMVLIIYGFTTNISLCHSFRVVFDYSFYVLWDLYLVFI